jgi:hypothetical protein
MVGTLETRRRLNGAPGTPDHREIRVRFESRTALLDGFALAQRESWIEDCHLDLPRLELVIRMAGGFWIQRGQHPVPRRPGRAALSIAC